MQTIDGAENPKMVSGCWAMLSDLFVVKQAVTKVECQLVGDWQMSEYNRCVHTHESRVPTRNQHASRVWQTTARV